MWNIGWAPNNVSKWQIGFNSAFKGLNLKLQDQKFSTEYYEGKFFPLYDRTQ
jgi:hypothetical protein